MARLLLYGEEDERRTTQVCEDVLVGVEAGSWNVFHVFLERSREAPTVLPYLRFGNFAD